MNNLVLISNLSKKKRSRFFWSTQVGKETLHALAMCMLQIFEWPYIKWSRSNYQLCIGISSQLLSLFTFRKINLKQCHLLTIWWNAFNFFFLNICHISNTVFTPSLNNHNKTNTWYACIYIKDLQIQLYSK